MSKIDRRSFLAAAVAAPLCASTGVRWLPAGNKKVLIVLELAGGNDGLGTLLPLSDPRFGKLRPNLGKVRSRAHEVADGYGVHPELPQLGTMLREGGARAIHGVGYTPPDRSHFRSRDIWHTADPDHVRVGANTTGWLGRAADKLAAEGAAAPAMAVGSLQAPLALRGRRAVVPAIDRVEEVDYEVDGRGGLEGARREALRRFVDDADGDDPLNRDIEAVARAAMDESERIRTALSNWRPKASWPTHELGERLHAVARLAGSGYGTRLFHVAHTGFDTHARQQPTHAGLLRQLDGALAALRDELLPRKLWRDTLVVVHSEFGRRAAENASQGTDHGAAAPVFLLGGAVAPGLLGEAPDLGQLVDGDLPATTDFRTLYGDALAFLGLDPREILGPGIQRAKAV